MVNKIGQNPFTPKSGMEPKYFAGRGNAIKTFQKILAQSKSKRYEHFCVLGEWGVGKTVLLKEYKK